MHRVSFLLVVLCLHCGGQTKTGPTDEAPATPSPTETPAADTDEPSTPPAPAEAETEAPSDTAAPAATPSKPVCAKLSKSDCQVRQGCAWSDKQKCVEVQEGI